MDTLTEETKILRALKAAGRRGLTTAEMMRISASNYRARCVSLRQDGYLIHSERVYLPNGRYAGYFRYYLNEEKEAVVD